MPIRRRQKLVSEEQLSKLLADFEAGTAVDEKNVLSFHNRDLNELESILPDAFEADQNFTAKQMYSLLREALWTCRKKGNLTTKKLVVEAQRIANDQLRMPKRPFSMYTKFRALNMQPDQRFRIKWGNVTIESTVSLPAYMEIGDVLETGLGPIDPDKPANFGFIIARCKARTPENAVREMLDATELVMAIFNMYESYGRRNLFGGERLEEGKLWHGPYHFIFQNKKFLGEDRFWYEPDYDEKAWHRFPLTMPEVLKQVPRIKKALVALSKHPFRDSLVHVLKLMQKAMTTRDQGYRLLRYWSALEQLYGDPQSKQKNYNSIIERASFSEPDRLMAQWKLSHISRRRNEYVHASDNDDDLFIMAQYLRGLLSHHVNYLLFHSPKIRSHKHWLEIVDLPSDVAELKRRKTVIDQRIALMG